ncbi:MAG: C39 family peptidase [Deltaproteobacteria bacterium]|nr:C39 family peptidase [Deltaproteobacteria bacterium]
MDISDDAPIVDHAVPALEEARRLYEQGLYLQAWRAAAPAGPLTAWTGLDASILAAQLAAQLGNTPLSNRLYLRLRRRHADSERAWGWVVRTVLSRRGAFAALAMLRRGGPFAEPGAETLALWASTAALLKDFSAAEGLIARAEALEPSRAWIRLERAHVLGSADDPHGALAAVDEALRLRPSYRPALEARADLLVSLGREEEALALLRDATWRLESAGIAWTLLNLQMEREEKDEAARTLARVEELSPLRSRAFEAYLAQRRSDLAWLQGDREATIRLARASRSPFHQRLADRLEAGRQGPRRVLPVASVRQHDKTCAPATLASLSGFHGVEALHLEIAEAICYDGTPDWAERRWAQERGFRVREFTVTWAAAKALVDRGLPFTLTTVEPGSAHLQAVVGYDESRATLLIRDPSFRSLTELAEPGLDDYRACGPRGMVPVPPGKEALLDGLDLPEADLHDLYHGVQAALVAHRRDEAEGLRRSLDARAPGHRLALQAARALAAYDGDEEARLAATEALLALFPDDVNLRLAKQASLADLGRRTAQVEYLRAECARAGHPLLTRALAEAIRLDARALPEAEALCRRVLQARPYDAAGYLLLGNVRWERQEREEALPAYRAAACLEWTDERYAEVHFRAARWLGRSEEGLDLLRWRVRRQGGRSGQPVVTLFESLDTLERTAEANAELEQALVRRPADGALLLLAARVRAVSGDFAGAWALLERARGSVRPVELLRAEASLAERAGEAGRAAELWSSVAEVEPLDVVAARAAARLTAATRGRPAALAALRRQVERFPHHQGLAQVLVGWLDEEPEPVAEAELRRLLGHHPSDAWAWRELAANLSAQRRADEALAALERARAIDPSAASLHNVRALVLQRAGRTAEAKAELLESLACAADEGWALRRLLDLSADAAERRAHLAAALAELRRQVLLGDGLLEYQALAQRILDPAELLENLREGHRQRPDLWQAWVALARQQVHAGALAEARALLAQAAQRFPLLPRIAVEQAQVERLLGNRDARRRALERAVALSPSWPEAAIDLSGLLQEAGELEAERQVLERALRHAPGEALLHGWLADALRLAGREAEALEQLERALRLDPGYRWAWDTLVQLREDRGEAGRPRALAQAIAEERPRDARAWVLVALASRAPADRLAALEEATRADPQSLQAWELRADALADAGRHDEALAACRPPVFGETPPRSLQLRAVRLRGARGDRPGALEDLGALLRAEPDYLEAWQLRADWDEERGDPAAALEAADELVRLAPHRPVSHGFRGQALLATGAREEAKGALRRALELDPAYPWALRRLLALEIEDREEEAARRTLELVERHLGPGEARLGAVRLAARGGDRQRAVEGLGPLLRCPRWGGQELAEALDGAGWGADLDRALAGALGDPAVARHAGALWAGRAAASGRWLRGGRVLRRALAQSPAAPAALGAASEWLERLATARRPRAIRALLRRHREALQADVYAWGTGGFALSSTRQHRQVVAWMAGWRGREGLRPWMLINLVASLRDLGREEEAREVGRAALGLPEDHCTASHRIYLASDAALASAPDPLAGVVLPESGYARQLAELALAVAAGLAGDDPRPAWLAAMDHLRRGRFGARTSRREPFLRRYRRRAVWAVARRRSRLRAPFLFLAGMSAAGAFAEE